MKVAWLAILVPGLSWAEPPSSLVPKGFHVVDSAHGDLDKDGRKDWVLALSTESDDGSAEGQASLLLVYFAAATGTWDKKLASSSALCFGCGGAKGEPGVPLGTPTVAGSIPEVGEKFVHNSFQFTVHAKVGPRLDRVRVSKPRVPREGGKDSRGDLQPIGPWPSPAGGTSSS